MKKLDSLVIFYYAEEAEHSVWLEMDLLNFFQELKNDRTHIIERG